MDRRVHGDQKTSMWFPRELLHQAKVQAAREGRTLRELFVEALRNYLKRTGG